MCARSHASALNAEHVEGMSAQSWFTLSERSHWFECAERQRTIRTLKAVQKDMLKKICDF